MSGVVRDLRLRVESAEGGRVIRFFENDPDDAPLVALFAGGAAAVVGGTAGAWAAVPLGGGAAWWVATITAAVLPGVAAGRWCARWMRWETFVFAEPGRLAVRVGPRPTRIVPLPADTRAVVEKHPTAEDLAYLVRVGEGKAAARFGGPWDRPAADGLAAALNDALAPAAVRSSEDPE